MLKAMTMEEQAMQDVLFQDISVEEQLTDIINRVVASSETRCTANPTGCLHAVRDGIYSEVDSDSSPRLVARMMSGAGDDMLSKRVLMNDLIKGNLQVFRL